MNRKPFPALCLALLFLFLLISCSRNEVVSTSIVTLAAPSQTGTSIEKADIALTPTMDATIQAWLTNRPRDMESYGFVFDENAVAKLPPTYSVDMPIWGQSLPFHSFNHVPELITFPEPSQSDDIEARLDQAGCSFGDYGSIECSSDSPLSGFACEYLNPVDSYATGVLQETRFMAVCLNTPENEDEDRSQYLFRRGCAFRKDVAYIVDQNDSYSLISTPEQLAVLFTPIDSPEKTLAYAMLASGLEPTFSFDPDPDLLYFQDPLEGTHVTETKSGYTVNLFHYQTCLCEPWINSVVFLAVNRDGSIVWQGAAPVSMTIGFSCAD